MIGPQTSYLFNKPTTYRMDGKTTMYYRLKTGRQLYIKKKMIQTQIYVP